MNPTIRPLAKDDAADFRRVRLLGLQESPTAFGASLAQEQKLSVDEMAGRIAGSPDCWVLGAFGEQGLVGVVGFIRDGGDKSRHKGFIWGMYVVPECRGRGIGGKLFEAALARIDATPGLRSVRLTVVTTNHTAVRLYERCGFVRFGEEADSLYVDGVFHSEFHLVRRVPASKKP